MGRDRGEGGRECIRGDIDEGARAGAGFENRSEA